MVGLLFKFKCHNNRSRNGDLIDIFATFLILLIKCKDLKLIRKLMRKDFLTPQEQAYLETWFTVMLPIFNKCQSS